MAVRHMLEFSMGLLGVCFALCLVASLTNSLLRRNNWNELDQEHVTFFKHIYCCLSITFHNFTLQSILQSY